MGEPSRIFNQEQKNTEMNYSLLIGREKEENTLKTLLTNFGKLSVEDKITSKKGIYIYGEPGVGKSYFVKRVLREMNYDILSFDTGMVRNKALFDQISSNNMSVHSVLSMLKRNPKKIAIVMDDINSMNNGDKGSMSALIKIIRAKKTKKHKTEDTSMNPIICIGSGLNNSGKKISELTKACHVIELKRPTTEQIKDILHKQYYPIDSMQTDSLANYIQNDLNKLNIIMKLYTTNPDILNNKVFRDIFVLKSNNDSNKRIIKEIYNGNPSIETHSSLIGETERTTIGLYWHENIPDVIDRLNESDGKKTKTNKTTELYINVLNNMCFADYIDRITFKKQIWKFNEMSSLIKTFKTQRILSSYINNHGGKTTMATTYPFPESNIRFTKILTKYSNEYNNFVFFQEVGKKLCLDIKDIHYFFMKLKYHYPMTQTNRNCEINPVECENVSCIDIKRIYKYLTKMYVKNEILSKCCGDESDDLDLDLDEFDEEYIEYDN